MLAVSYLLKLYDVPPESGQISAFDTYANTIFAGTDKGELLKFAVEGASVAETTLPGEKFAGTDRGNGNSNNRKTSENRTSGFSLDPPPNSEKIYTTLVRRISLSLGKRRIDRVQHSRTHNLLFVLFEHRLVVLNSNTLSHIHNIAESVGTFFVSDSQQNSHQSPGLHVICASELNGKGLTVFEFDASQGKHARAIITQELVLPEPAHAIVTYGNIACIGMRREYSLLSLADGNSCGVLPLGGGRKPLLSAGDGEVFMRHGQSIFSVSLRSMPSGHVLGRTIQLEDEALFFVVRHPFLFAFTDQYCDVCSLYDDAVSERLPLPGCLFASQLGRGDFLYTASKTTIWMAGLHSLRHQLADLVERFKVEEAFHLLGSQRAKAALDVQGIELELHIMAGFAYLHRCRPKDAMLHFNDHIDPRDLLLLLPECIPPSPDEYTSELKAFLATNTSKRFGECASATATEAEATSEGVEEGRSTADVGYGPKGSCMEGVKGKRIDDDGGFWAQWKGCCPYNMYAGELHKAWLETYETFPLFPRNNDEEPHVVYRQVNDWGAVTALTFIEHSWEMFKDELILYFRSRLGNSSVLYARVMEYALLVLALEAKDHRAMYRIVACGSSLSVEDCYDLLSSLREYRLLACLLHCRGYVEEAKCMLMSRVFVSSFIPTSVTQTGCEEHLAPAYKSLPKSMHVYLDRLLLPSVELGTNAMHPSTPWSSSGPLDTSETSLTGTTATALSYQLPPSLSEIMFLVANMNLPALQELLRESPEAPWTVDEEGCTLLHVLFALFVLLEGSEDDVASESGSALLNLILSCAILLLDHGVCMSALNARGLSCLDVVAVAADGVFLDIVVAALLADADVRGVAAAVGKKEFVEEFRAS